MGNGGSVATRDWVASCRVRVDRGSGRLLTVGVVENNPPELVYSDMNERAYGSMADAVVRLRRGETILCDVEQGQFEWLRELWESDSR